MKANKLAMISMLSLGLFGATMATTVQPTTAQAATTHSAKRSKSVKLAWRKSMKRHAYYTVKGSRYSAHLGANYGKMSKYPKTTWYTDKHEKLVVKKTKKARIYYHIVSGNKKHAGWIWKGYLITGVNPAAKVTTKSSSSAVSAKQAKRDLKKQRGIAQMKAYKNQKNHPKPVDNNNYDLNAIRTEVVKQLNEWRVKAGVTPLKVDDRLTNMGNARAIQLRTNFDHYDNNDNLIIQLPAFKEKFGLSKGTGAMTESIGGSTFQGDAKQEASDLLEGYRVDAKEQGDGGAHWASMMYKNYVTVGVGLANSSTGSNWKNQGYEASIVMNEVD